MSNVNCDADSILSRRITEVPAAADTIGVYQEIDGEDLRGSGLPSSYEMLPKTLQYENICLPSEGRDQIPDYANLPVGYVPPYANLPLVDKKT